MASPRVRDVAYLRVAHAAPKAPNVDIYINGKKTLSNVPYKAISDYNELPAGKYVVDVKVAGTRKNVIKENVVLERGNFYTAVAHGDVNKKLLLNAFKDTNRCPDNNKARVQFIHASYAAPAVDIYANKSLKVFNNVSYGSRKSINVGAGVYDLSVTPHGKTDVVLNLPAVKLEPKTTYTIIATGTPNDRDAPLNVIVAKYTKC
jgi:hypothetical protein